MGESVNRKVIYTAIFGDYNGLIPQPKVDGFDYICFTDNPNIKAKPWKVRQVEPHIKDDLTRSNRYIKILPHLFLKEYDVSIYMDGNVLVLNDLNLVLEKYLKEHKMATFSHEFTIPDGRNCIYKEYEAILSLQERGLYYKDNPKVMENHINFLREEEYPENNGLIKGTVLVRKHNDSEVVKVMEDWWIMVKNYSKRDQLSFNYVAWKNNFGVATIPGDLRRGNPYVYWLGKHRKDWSKKLAKTKFKMMLGLIKIPKI